MQVTLRFGHLKIAKPQEISVVFTAKGPLISSKLLKNRKKFPFPPSVLKYSPLWLAFCFLLSAFATLSKSLPCDLPIQRDVRNFYNVAFGAVGATKLSLEKECKQTTAPSVQLPKATTNRIGIHVIYHVACIRIVWKKIFIFFQSFIEQIVDKISAIPLTTVASSSKHFGQSGFKMGKNCNVSFCWLNNCVLDIGVLILWLQGQFQQKIMRKFLNLQHTFEDFIIFENDLISSIV